MDWSELSDKLSNFGERIGRSLKTMFGSRNERMVGDLTPLVGGINELEPWAQGLSGDEFKEKTREWMEALYRHRLIEERSTIDAVHEAGLELLRTRRAAGLSTHPYHWAGFVATGDWH